jgi:hypothetical protein
MCERSTRTPLLSPGRTRTSVCVRPPNALPLDAGGRSAPSRRTLAATFEHHRASRRSLSGALTDPLTPPNNTRERRGRHQE